MCPRRRGPLLVIVVFEFAGDLPTAPHNGRIVTSSHIRTSPKRDEFYYSSAAGLVPAEPAWAGWTVQSADSVKRGGDEVVLYRFFGTRDQYQAFKDSKDEHGHPIPGMRSPAG